MPSCPSRELTVITCHSRCKSLHDQTGGKQDNPAVNDLKLKNGGRVFNVNTLLHVMEALHPLLKQCP